MKIDCMQQISLALFDIDGVLTDGFVYVGSNGEETKRIGYEDIDGIFALKRNNVPVGFITGENTAFCDYVRRRFSPDVMVVGCKNKLLAFEKICDDFNVSPENCSFTGDSQKDIQLLRHVAFSFAPEDVIEDVKNAAKFVLSSRRGNGVVRDVAAFILEHNARCEQLPQMDADLPYLDAVN